MGTSACTSYSDTADPIPGLLQVANYIIQILYFSKRRLASKHTLTVVHKNLYWLRIFWSTNVNCFYGSAEKFRIFAVICFQFANLHLQSTVKLQAYLFKLQDKMAENTVELA